LRSFIPSDSNIVKEVSARIDLTAQAGIQENREYLEIKLREFLSRYLGRTLKISWQSHRRGRRKTTL
jgi:hypothetical protein